MTVNISYSVVLQSSLIILMTLRDLKKGYLKTEDIKGILHYINVSKNVKAVCVPIKEKKIVETYLIGLKYCKEEKFTLIN